MEYNKKILSRAKNLLTNPDISANELFELADIMNEYVDFIEAVNSIGPDNHMVRIEEILSQNMDKYCDELEKSIIDKHTKTL